MAERNDNPLTRPRPQEQGGESEYTTESAHIRPDERPEEAHRAAPEEGPPRRRELSERPDELGRHFLEGATQQPQADSRPRRERPAPEQQALDVSPGERATREQDPEAERTDAPLLTHMPERTEHERNVSQKARRRVEEGETHREGPEESPKHGSTEL